MGSCPELDHEDMQALLRYSHKGMPLGCALVLSLTNAAAFKRGLAGLLKFVPNAHHARSRAERPKSALHAAFTYQGMEALMGPAPPYSYRTEFIEGMAEPDRSRLLGDEGESDPGRWSWGGPATPPVHALLTLYAATSSDLEGLEGTVQAALQAGARVLVRENVALRPDLTEPFGFKDGMGQPVFSPAPTEGERAQGVVRAGEFVFGYPDEFDQPSLGPVLPKGHPAGQFGFPIAENGSGDLHLGVNGSYLVVRKLEQDVKAFWDYVEHTAASLNMTPDHLAAKFVGRHKNGVPLVLCPEGDPARASIADDQLDRFFYNDEKSRDQLGYVCPHASHIRRCNPRDGLGDDRELSIAQARTHRLLRRGRPYSDSDPGAPKSQGILFLAFNCDIRRQFEFVQHTWVNNPKFADLYDTRDPVTGNNNGLGSMVIPHEKGRIRIQGIPRFVTVRAGGYFFLPGQRALRALVL